MPAREEYHIIKWSKTYWKEDCPLCKVLENNEQHILWNWKYWFILHNIYPYTGQENHIMAVPKIHKKYSYELSTEETMELCEVFCFVKKFFWEQKYFSMTRETLDNRSIEHFHIHFLAWKLQGKYIRNMLMNQWFPVIQYLDEK